MSVHDVNVDAVCSGTLSLRDLIAHAGEIGSEDRRSEHYRVGLPHCGRWQELLNTDAAVDGGSNLGNYGGVEAEDVAWQGQSSSAEITLPPLAVVWFVPEA